MRTPAIALLLLAGTAAGQTSTSGRASQTRGTVVLSDVNRASVSFHVQNNGRGMRGQQILLAPSFDVFLGSHFTLGAAPSIAYERTSSSHSIELGGDVRLGGYAPFANRWAIWPTVALGAYRYTTSLRDDTSRVTLRTRLDVPVLYYPAPGFFVGAGPLVGVALATARGNISDPYVTFGLLTTLGGTF